MEISKLTCDAVRIPYIGKFSLLKILAVVSNRENFTNEIFSTRHLPDPRGSLSSSIPS